MHPDNFDKQIREVLTNKHFAYEPAAWEQAAALLDQQKRKKRLFWWIWPALGILLLTIVGAVQYAQRPTPAPASSLANHNTPALSSVQGSIALPDTAETNPAAEVTENALDQTPNAQEHQSTEGFYSTKKTIQKPPYKKPAAFNPGVDSASQASFENYSLLQPKGFKMLQRIFKEKNLGFKETEAIPMTSIEPKKMNSSSLSLGFHSFGGTTLENSEGKRPFNYGGGFFVEMRYNKLYLALEPAVHQIQGVSGSSSRSDTSYSFGEIIKTQRLHWNNLLVVQLPVVLGLEIYPNHTIAAGFLTQQYLQSNYTLSETTTRQGYPPSETSQTGGQARINDLYVPRFIGLFRYQYQLSPAFSLGLQYNLVNSTRPTPLPSQLQFQLKYHLFNRSRQ